jgi:hypothetical protein
MCIYKYIYIYIYIHIYIQDTHTHTHIYIYIHICDNLNGVMNDFQLNGRISLNDIIFQSI